MEIRVESLHSSYTGWWKGVKTLKICDFKNPRCGSGTRRLRLAHTTTHTHSSLPPHPQHIATYHASSSSKTLGVPDSGVHQPRCPEHTSPRHPLTRTHMYRNADTQRRPWTHSHGRKPPCAASPASAHVLAPPRVTFWDCSHHHPEVGSAGSGGSTFGLVPTQEWRKQAKESRAGS